MRLEHSFEVAAAPEQAWALLMDVPRVVPCLPGAELVGTTGDDAWSAKLSVKLGPMTMTFDADVTREETDEEARSSRLVIRAREARGRGGATATVQSSLSEANGGTRVALVTELAMRGLVAQAGRPVAKDVSAQLVDRFADCLRGKLSGVEAAGPVPTEARPVSLLALLLGSLRRILGR
jgi:carbon monoxide dehydrogenase subunit G